MTSNSEERETVVNSLDQWSIREKLHLAFAIARVGEHNWMSVSRCLKPFADGKPVDWFNPRKCAAQYEALLDNLVTPKRKKRGSGVEFPESPNEIIIHTLIGERKAEMRKSLQAAKAEYQRLQEELHLLASGQLTEKQLDQMIKEIDRGEYQKALEEKKRVECLRRRENRPAGKQSKPIFLPIGQKRKTY